MSIEIPGYRPGTWVLDPSHSEVTFSVRHMMISKVRGSFGIKNATLVAPENPLEAKVEASVDVTSIDTNDEGRDQHLRSADFFDTENFPTMEFVSTGARVQEVADLKVSNLLLAPQPRATLHGKGGKWRTCPLWPETARLLRAVLEQRPGAVAPEAPVFVSRHGSPLTRFGI